MTRTNTITTLEEAKSAHNEMKKNAKVSIFLIGIAITFVI